MKIEKFKLNESAKEKVLAELVSESEKKSMSDVLMVVEASANAKIAEIAKVIKIKAESHFKNFYAERAKSAVKRANSRNETKVKNLCSMAINKWKRENKVALISTVREAKAKRIARVLESAMVNLGIGVSDKHKTIMESQARKLKALQVENTKIHRELAGQKTENSRKKKLRVFESAIRGLTQTQTEKLKALTRQLPSMSVAQFSESVKNIRSMVTNATTSRKTERFAPAQRTENTTSPQYTSILRG